MVQTFWGCHPKGAASFKGIPTGQQMNAAEAASLFSVLDKSACRYVTWFGHLCDSSTALPTLPWTCALDPEASEPPVQPPASLTGSLGAFVEIVVASDSVAVVDWPCLTFATGCQMNEWLCIYFSLLKCQAVHKHSRTAGSRWGTGQREMKSSSHPGATHTCSSTWADWQADRLYHASVASLFLAFPYYRLSGSDSLPWAGQLHRALCWSKEPASSQTSMLVLSEQPFCMKYRRGRPRCAGRWGPALLFTYSGVPAHLSWKRDCHLMLMMSEESKAVYKLGLISHLVVKQVGVDPTITSFNSNSA